MNATGLQSHNKTKSVSFFVHIAADPSFKNGKIFGCFINIINLILQTAH